MIVASSKSNQLERISRILCQFYSTRPVRGEGSTAPLDARGPYPDAVVSLWRLDLEGKEADTFLSLGVLIRSKWILITRDALDNLLPLNTIGFYTGRSFADSRKMENSAIIEELNILGCDRFVILVVSTSA